MADQEVVVTDVPLADNPTITPVTADTDPPPAEKDPLKTPHKEEEEKVSLDTENLKPGNKADDKIAESDSFKEESTKLADLPDSEKKSLEEFKQLIREALNNHEFTALSPPPLPPKVEENPSEVVEKTDEPSKDAEESSGEEVPSKSETKVAEAVEEAEKANEVTPPAKSEAEAATEKVVVAEVIEETVAVKIDAVDDDGAKTVEAIEETIVAVSSVIPSEQPKPAPNEVDETAVKVENEDVKSKTPPLTPPEEVSIWGIPLLADERSEVVLLKFLRARDFKVKDAFTMIKNTVRWRKEFGIVELLEEDLGNDLDKVAFMHGFDKEGHPVCYNVYGEFQKKELYQKTFSDEEKRQKFLRWRIQFLERSIRKLDFSPGGICTMVQVNDLKNSPGPGKWELRQATTQALQLFQDNYPEFVAKQVFINVPWWYLAVNRMISPFLTHRTKSKFVFAGPSKSAETLLRYITAEQVPVKYGGLSKEGEFERSDRVTEITVKPAAKHTVEFPVSQGNCVLTWEVRVVGWEVSYGAEFVPSAEGSYTVIIQKPRKVSVGEEAVVSNSFKVGEVGKVVLSIDNPTSKKKKLLYRLKTKPSNPNPNSNSNSN